MRIELEVIKIVDKDGNAYPEGKPYHCLMVDVSEIPYGESYHKNFDRFKIEQMSTCAASLNEAIALAAEALEKRYLATN